MEGTAGAGASMTWHVLAIGDVQPAAVVRRAAEAGELRSTRQLCGMPRSSAACCRAGVCCEDHQRPHTRQSMEPPVPALPPPPSEFRVLGLGTPAAPRPAVREAPVPALPPSGCLAIGVLYSWRRGLAITDRSAAPWGWLTRRAITGGPALFSMPLMLACGAQVHHGHPGALHWHPARRADALPGVVGGGCRGCGCARYQCLDAFDVDD